MLKTQKHPYKIIKIDCAQHGGSSTNNISLWRAQIRLCPCTETHPQHEPAQYISFTCNPQPRGELICCRGNDEHKSPELKAHMTGRAGRGAGPRYCERASERERRGNSRHLLLHLSLIRTWPRSHASQHTTNGRQARPKGVANSPAHFHGDHSP